ncbi:holin [Gordonia phage GTE8]|uniref:Putative holin n=1 Tax=Gordonia phage GTE8 TaxID=1647475 RepID=A0A0K0N6U1_9CAUD|nr:holin [Gordonia phage GTE8]AKJ72381.1 putative holin [Gordonia phage GTE8]
MTLPNIPPVPATEVVDELREQLQRQPWYARFANTVTTAVGALALIVWLLTSNGVGIDPAIVTAVGSVLGVLTTLGVLKTPNGITPRGVEKVEDAAQLAARRFE